jgi:hypothetical protein
LLQRTATETTVIDAVLIKSLTESIQLDALLQKTGQLKTSDLDAHLYYLRTISTNIDAILKATSTEITSLDAVLSQLAVTSTATLDALLYQQQISTLSIDSILTQTLTKSMDLDAFLSSEITVTSFLDAVLYSVLLTVNPFVSFVTVFEKSDFISITRRPGFNLTLQ